YQRFVQVFWYTKRCLLSLHLITSFEYFIFNFQSVILIWGVGISPTPSIYYLKKVLLNTIPKK
ncbi:hypothetical protein ABFP88_12660, partial [Clostridioides difficile]